MGKRLNHKLNHINFSKDMKDRLNKMGELCNVKPTALVRQGTLELLDRLESGIMNGKKIQIGVMFAEDE
jgi:hypothetical protein